MNDAFRDHNEFDAYAREHGGWVYDNGWTYKDEHFGAAYQGPGGLVMVREGRVRDQTLVLASPSYETLVWSGLIRTRGEFDAMMSEVDRFLGLRGLEPGPDPSQS